ncbi:efflux RND transporter periplasmic adaptor subunit [Aliiroseovarius sp. F20344]|uniref:efflux RND transporter periplasmic adaptor subunit n=1 Tax=Aliiroseovarius sp. F20344 TaxID=2926414 RepID=UPI001FF33B85|nr:efflux RND transporter periplasmic adaptor subunit [Aliiroseovarius sp. F20344]MCK0143900.1 efflux RND transporter periplasmic adaptor subunit [Aliiroseovarius sp. F20344]
MNEVREDISQTLQLGKPKWRGRLWLWSSLAALIAVAALWFAVLRPGGAERVEYETATASRGDLVVTVTATGTIEPTNLVEISSELSGTLASVEVDFNDTVTVGTVLARLDTRKLEAQLLIAKASLDAAIARVAVAQALLDDAREKYEAALDLEARGVTSQQVFSTKQAAFKRAQAELQSAVADRALAEANLDLHQTDLDRACICSPIDGVVLDRTVDPGQIVAASLSAPILFTVAQDLEQMELQVNVDEADIGSVAVGKKASFTVDAYDEKQFLAEITQVRVSPEIVDGVVTYKTILTVDNSDLLLRPGMTATADIVVAEISDALVVPNAALRYTPPQEMDTGDDEDRSGLLGMLIPDMQDAGAEIDNKTLWILKDGVPQEIAVTAGQTDGRMTVIQHGSLVEGDVLITDQIDG